MSPVARRLRVPPALGLAFLVLAIACSESRTEGRQRRLDTFRQALPTEVRTAFDSIEAEEDCEAVGELITAARASDPGVDAKLDSIMHAELIDTFTDEELAYFFWYYFAHAIETGTVPEP
ncbi:MAG: hypothetical protein ACQETZ_11090 [Candidatus Fermentibacterota bacterium]